MIEKLPRLLIRAVYEGQEDYYDLNRDKLNEIIEVLNAITNPEPEKYIIGGIHVPASGNSPV